jgi:hypothetical protein
MGILAVAGLLHYIGHQMRLRIVPDGSGALMAVDADGLRQLNALYALPKVCGDAEFRTRTDPGAWLKLCMRAVPIKPETVKKGTVLLPAGTKAISMDTRYVLPDGRFAVSYSPPNISRTITDGVVEVEHVRITQPPGRNLEGWVAGGYLQRTFGPFP